jgi:hypothetical protein
MERAQQQAAAPDLSNFLDTKLLPKFTIASFSNDIIVSKASKLGVSLGRMSSQVNKSITTLKESDLACTLIFLKRNEEKFIR